MFVQWCLKGIPGGTFNDATALDALTKAGLSSNWFRNNPRLTQDDAARERRLILTEQAIYDHLNNYNSVGASTPYISLTAGCVERNKYLATNIAHSALQTALDFATDSGRNEGYIFKCWVTLSLNPSPEIESVAEEVRELNTYTRYSCYQLEGEVAAKIHVPANQIKECLKVDAAQNLMARWPNPQFAAPNRLGNIRTCI